MQAFKMISAEELLKKKFPNPKTHPKLRYPFAGVVVGRQLKRERPDEDVDHYSVTVICCPFCGKRHHHGVSVPRGKTVRRGHNFGHRESHCVVQDVKCNTGLMNGYVLVNTSTHKSDWE